MYRPLSPLIFCKGMEATLGHQVCASEQGSDDKIFNATRLKAGCSGSRLRFTYTSKAFYLLAEGCPSGIEPYPKIEGCKRSDR